MTRDPQASPPRKFNPFPFAYHQEIELDIATLTNMGQGLGRIDNWVVLVNFALPGERIRARVYRNDKNFSQADLVEVLDRSPHRVEAPCPHFGICGGCQYQNLEYIHQLAWKSRQVRELLLHMAKVDHPVLPAIPSPKQYGYRSKITPHFPKPKKGQPVRIGYLRAGTRSSYVEIEQCPIATPAMNQRLAELKREIQARQDRHPHKRGGTLLIREHAGGVTTNPKEIIQEQVGDFIFSFPAGEFFQNNPSILPAFADHVRQQAANSRARFLVDAYCGSGLFCLTAARSFEHAVGVEVSEQSVAWARRNAESNGIANATFVLGDAASLFQQMDFPGEETAVIIDPPRKGSNEDFLRQLVVFRPRSIVYVSCNPATQMRDLDRLFESGYRIQSVQPFDLFPQTKHLECVITLERGHQERMGQA